MKQLLAVLVLFAVLQAGALHAASIEKTAAAVPAAETRPVGGYVVLHLRG